jgi:serine/threonine protein kinase HipA of HipAB toxin-antitoxin module
MAADGKHPRDLLVERISRLEKQGVETNKQLAETNKRLDKVVAILSGIANTLVGQGREIERHSQILERHSQILQALTERFDRFSDMVIIGRTRDTKRVGELERRVETRERQVSGRTPPVRS